MVLTRRALAGRAGGLALFVGLKSFVPFRCVRAQAITDKLISFRWRVPAAHYQTVANSLIHAGAVELHVELDSETKGVPFLAIFVGVAMLPSLAEAVLTLRDRLVKPGLIIDTRESQIKIEVNSTIPKGMILIVSSSGAELIDRPHLTFAADLSKAIAAEMGK